MSVNSVRSIIPPLLSINVTPPPPSFNSEKTSTLELFIEAGFCDLQGILTFTPTAPSIEPDAQKISALRRKLVRVGDSEHTIGEYIDLLIAELNKKSPVQFKVYLRGSYAAFILNPKERLRSLIDQFIEKHPDKRTLMEEAWNQISHSDSELKEPNDIDCVLQLDFPPDKHRLTQFRKAIIELHCRLANVDRTGAKDKTFANLLIPKPSKWIKYADPVVISSVSGENFKLDIDSGLLNTTYVCTYDNHCIQMGANPTATSMKNEADFWQSMFDYALGRYRLKRRHAKDFSVGVKMLTALTQGKWIDETRITLKEIVSPFLGEKYKVHKIYNYISTKLKHKAVDKTAFMINFLSLVDDPEKREALWRSFRAESSSFTEDASQIFEQKRAFPSLYGEMPLFKSGKAKPDLQFMKERLFAENDPLPCTPDCFYAEWRMGCENLRIGKPMPDSCFEPIAEMLIKGMLTAEEEQRLNLSRQKNFQKVYKVISEAFLSKTDNPVPHLQSIGSRVPSDDKLWVVQMWIELVHDQKIPLDELLKRVPVWLNGNLSKECKEAIALELLRSRLFVEPKLIQLCAGNVSKNAFITALEYIPIEQHLPCVYRFPEEDWEAIADHLSFKEQKDLWHKILTRTQSIFTLWKMERKEVPAPGKMAQDITNGFVSLPRKVGAEIRAELEAQITALQVNALEVLFPNLAPEMKEEAAALVRKRMLDSLAQGDLVCLEKFLKSKTLQDYSGVTLEEMRQAHFTPEQSKALLSILTRISSSNKFLPVLCEMLLELQPNAHSEPSFCRILFSFTALPPALAQTLTKGVLENPDAYPEEIKSDPTSLDSVLYKLYPYYLKRNLPLTSKLVQNVLDNIDQVESPAEVLESFLQKIILKKLVLKANLIQQLLTSYFAHVQAPYSVTFSQLNGLCIRDYAVLVPLMDSTEGLERTFPPLASLCSSSNKMQHSLQKLLEEGVKRCIDANRPDLLSPHSDWLETKILPHCDSLRKPLLHCYLNTRVGSSIQLQNVSTPDEALLAFKRLQVDIETAPEREPFLCFIHYCLENKIAGPAKTLLALLETHPQFLKQISSRLLRYILFCSTCESLELLDRVNLLTIAVEHLGATPCREAFDELTKKARSTGLVSSEFCIAFLKIDCLYPDTESFHLPYITSPRTPEYMNRVKAQIQSLTRLNTLSKNILPFADGDYIDNVYTLLIQNRENKIPCHEKPYIEVVARALLQESKTLPETLNPSRVTQMMDAWYDTLPEDEIDLAWYRLQRKLFERLEKQPFLQFFQIYLNLTKSYYETKHKNLERFTAQFMWLLNAAFSHPHYAMGISFPKLILDGLNLIQRTKEMYFYSLFARAENDLDSHPFFKKLRALAPKPDLEVIESALELATLRCDAVGLAWSDSIIFQLSNVRSHEPSQLQMIRKYVAFYLRMGWTKEEIKEHIDYICPDQAGVQKYHRVLKGPFPEQPKPETTLKQKMFHKVVMAF